MRRTAIVRGAAVAAALAAGTLVGPATALAGPAAVAQAMESVTANVGAPVHTIVVALGMGTVGASAFALGRLSHRPD